MSKYVRYILSDTDWGRFYEPEEVITNKEDFDLAKNMYNLEVTFIKQANTIKELCDCFVYIDKRLPNSRPKIYYEWDKLFFENQFEEELGLDRDECEVYGAIWTDKGLIYVARKIEEYGEWVLL